MNYQAHYDSLISRSRGRVLSCYVERHHVLPRCLGGDDSDANIALLTPEEHYVAHQLLVKLNRGHKGLTFAAIRMTSKGRGNKLYGWIRKCRSKSLRGRKHSPETIAKMSATKKGKPKSEATKAKIAAAIRGKKLPAEQKAKIAAASQRMWQNPERFLERNAKIAAALLGHSMSEESREKSRLSNKLTWATKRRG